MEKLRKRMTENEFKQMRGMENNCKLEEEKIRWLEEIGAVCLREPMIYAVRLGRYLFSERYLKETPLSEMKKHFESTKN